MNWTEEYIGNIIIYSNLSNKKEKIAIVDIYKEIINTIKVIDYPISLDSRISLLGLRKNQEKENLFQLEKPGDWYFLEKASIDEIIEIHRIKNSTRVFLESF